MNTQQLKELREEASQIIGLLTVTGSAGLVLDKVADFFDDIFKQLETAERERDELLSEVDAFETKAPTQWAYDAACRAYKMYRASAEAAEAELARRDAEAGEAVDFSKCRTLWYEHDDLSADVECTPWGDVKAALDAANVKYEVKK